MREALTLSNTARTRLAAVRDALGIHCAFNMVITYNDGSAGFRDYKGENVCGSVACIGGHAIAMFTPQATKRGICECDLTELAATALDLDEDITKALCFPPNDLYWEAATPEQGKAAINNVLESGDPKWSEVLQEGTDG